MFAEYNNLPDLAADGGYLRRFRNMRKRETGFLRGYAINFSTSRNLVQFAP